MIPNMLNETPEQMTRRHMSHYQDLSDADLMKRFTPFGNDDDIGPAPWQWPSATARHNAMAFAGIFEDRPD